MSNDYDPSDPYFISSEESEALHQQVVQRELKEARERRRKRAEAQTQRMNDLKRENEKMKQQNKLFDQALSAMRSYEGGLTNLAQLPESISIQHADGSTTTPRTAAAEARRKELEDQLNSNKYGIAYVDADMKIAQFDETGSYVAKSIPRGLVPLELWDNLDLVGLCDVCGMDDAPIVASWEGQNYCKFCRELDNLKHDLPPKMPKVVDVTRSSPLDEAFEKFKDTLVEILRRGAVPALMVLFLGIMFAAVIFHSAALMTAVGTGYLGIHFALRNHATKTKTKTAHLSAQERLEQKRRLKE